MLAVLIVGMVVLTFRPLAGFYVCYALLLIVPITDQRVDFPVFHSPLQAIAFLTIGGALIRFPNSERPFPRSRLYLPLVIVIALYIMFTLVGHGDSPSTRFFAFVTGLWPLILILLLVETPRQARNAFIGMCAVSVALTLLWLPGLLALSQSKSGQLGEQIRSGKTLVGFADNPGAVSLLGIVGHIGVQTLVALAMVATVLLGVGIATRKWRLAAFFGFVTIGLTVFTATIASAVATLAVGCVSLVIFYAVPAAAGRLRDKSRSVINIFMIMIAVAAIGLSTPPGKHALDRLTNPKNDVSGEVRLNSLSNGWHAFLEQPWIGQGVAITYRASPEGWPLAGHNTFGVMAYEYGLVMLVPFAWMLVTIGGELWRLLRHSTTDSEAGIAAGFLACFTAAVVTGFLTPTFGQVFQDSILWTLVGLAIVWNTWRRADPGAPLMA